MKHSAMGPGCLALCLSLAVVFAGCSSSTRTSSYPDSMGPVFYPKGVLRSPVYAAGTRVGRGPTPKPGQVRTNGVVSKYQRSLCKRDLADIPYLVDQDVQTDCRALVDAYGRYDRSGRRLATLLRSQHGDKLAQSFLGGSFAVFGRVALQTLFFVYTADDDPVYAGQVDLIPTEGSLRLVVEGQATEYCLRPTATGWKISRREGNDDWRMGMKTARRQLDALRRRFDGVSRTIEKKKQISKARLSELLLLGDGALGQRPTPAPAGGGKPTGTVARISP